MTLYQFNLPAHSNDGLVDYSEARRVWERMTLAAAGGFTDMGTQRGAWKDDAGNVYLDTMHAYQVATSPEVANELATRLFDLFPDQLAFYVAEVGSARIFERPKVAA